MLDVARPLTGAIALLLGAGSLPAQSESMVAKAAWLTGCWEQANGQRTVEERWMAPRGGVMLGVGRTVREGNVRDYEFVVLSAKEGRLHYEAHPRGQATDTFHSVEVSDTALIFEDPAHDFPQRVGYRRSGRDSLIAWVEGDEGGTHRKIEFPYSRVRCE